MQLSLICDTYPESRNQHDRDPAKADNAQLVSAPEWIRRAYVPEDDEDAIVSQWCESYKRSVEGIERGAYLPFIKGDEQKYRSDVRDATRALWNEQAPLVEWLLRNADVEVVCDPERPRSGALGPAVIWGFACTSGDVVHYISIKRKVAEVPGLAADIARDLLGSRLERPCWFTHELVEMHPGHWGVSIPRSWGWDSLWLPRRLAAAVVGRRAA